MKNWAGNLTFSAEEFIEIESIPQLQKIVEKSKKLKVLGAGHSFSDIADTNGTLISLIWMRYLEPKGLSLWISTGISLIVGIIVARKG